MEEVICTDDFIKLIVSGNWERVADELEDAFKNDKAWFDRLNRAAYYFFDGSRSYDKLKWRYEKELYWITAS